jgi:hypothetical protein
MTLNVLRGWGYPVGHLRRGLTPPALGALLEEAKKVDTK